MGYQRLHLNPEMEFSSLNPVKRSPPSILSALKANGSSQQFCFKRLWLTALLAGCFLRAALEEIRGPLPSCAFTPPLTPPQELNQDARVGTTQRQVESSADDSTAASAEASGQASAHPRCQNRTGTGEPRRAIETPRGPFQLDQATIKSSNH